MLKVSFNRNLGPLAKYVVLLPFYSMITSLTVLV
jgi:hypothetical protein